MLKYRIYAKETGRKYREKESKGEKGYEPEGKSRFDRGRFIGYV